MYIYTDIYIYIHICTQKPFPYIHEHLYIYPQHTYIHTYMAYPTPLFFGKGLNMARDSS